MSSGTDKLTDSNILQVAAGQVESELRASHLQAELNKALHKISFLETEHGHLRECLRSAQETLLSRNGAVQNLQTQLKEERAKYIRFFDANSKYEINEETAASAQVATEQHDAEVAELKQQLDAIKAKSVDLETNNMSLYDSFKSLKNQLAQTRQEYTEFQQEHHKMVDSLKQSRDFIKQSYTEYKVESETKIRSAQTQYEQSIRVLEDKLMQAQANARTQIEALNKRNNEAQIQHTELLEQILQENEQGAQAMMTRHQDEIHQAERNLLQKEKDYNELMDKLQAANQQVWELQEKTSQAMDRENSLDEQVRSLLEKLSTQQQDLASLQNQVSVLFQERNSLATRLEQMQAELVAANNRQKCINDVISDQNEEVERLNSVNLQLAKGYREKEKKALELEERLQEAQDQLQGKELDIQRAAADNSELRGNQQRLQTQIGEQAARIADLEEKIRAQADHSENKDKQFRFYSENINRSKRDLREQGYRLIQELKLNRQTSPLSEFLKVTNREVSRVEVQLKRTPTSSADRSRLEQCLTDLVEQRDFLKESLEKSSQDIDAKIRRLSEIIGGENLAMTPPPPPATETY